MPSLIGTAPNQVPTNGLLGSLAFQNKEAVSIDNLTVGIVSSLYSEDGLTTTLSLNRYLDGGTVKYKVTGASSSYEQYNGGHYWFSSASGSAGTSISNNQLMYLTSSGDVDLSTNSPSGPMIYSSESVPLRFGISGAERLRLDASGNLGLGVAPEAWKSTTDTTLQINGTSLTGFGYHSSSLVTGAYLNSSTLWTRSALNTVSNRFDLLSGGGFSWLTSPGGAVGTSAPFTELMTLDSYGNLGVAATPNGSYKLQVGGGALLSGLNVSNGGGVNSANTATFDTNGAGVARFYSRGANTSTVGSYQWRLQSSNGSVDTQAMTLDSSGNLGIGTSSPGYKLEIRNDVLATTNLEPTAIKLFNNFDGGSGIEFSNGVAGKSKISFGVQSSGAGTDDTYLGFSTSLNGGALTERARIDSSGNLLVGAASSNGTLTVSRSGSGNKGFFTNTTDADFAINCSSGVTLLSPSTGTLALGTSSTERLRIDSSGNVGIGTSSPQTKLHVSGDVQVRAPGSSFLKLRSDVQIISWNNSTDTGYVPGSLIGQTVSIAAGDGSKVSIFDSSGNLGLGVVPSGWGSYYKAIESTTASEFCITSQNNGIELGRGYYKVNAGFGSTYTTGQAPSKYAQGADGSHSWQIAPSGTAGNAISFTQAMTLDASNRLLIGSTVSKINALTSTTLLQVEGTTAAAAISVNRNTADTLGSHIVLGKSRGATAGSFTTVNSGDSVGILSFQGADGVGLVQAASITGAIDGTPGTNDMPGRLVLSTTADGSATPTERLRIDSYGNVGIGTSSPQVKLDVAGEVRATAFLLADSAVGINDIGVPGKAGFGVGICPGPLPDGMTPLSNGTYIPFDADYGNYQYSDGSIMVWIPAFYYKYGTGSNGFATNIIDIKKLSAYVDEAAANAAGYALHRAFYNAGSIRLGVFVDKYLCSNNAGIASSIRNGNPISSNSAHNPFSGLTSAPSNTYAGAIAAAKIRGSNFFCSSLFINKMLAMLANAHGSASTGTAFNAWYSSSSTNFPKGCNNNALGDANDGTLSFMSDGYSNVSKTGSANFLAKTSHNGQNCGVVDLNGCMQEVTPGLTMDSSDPAVGKLYVLKTSVNMASVTGGNTLATDLWGSSGLVALYDDLGVMNSFTGYAVNFSDRTLTMGSASQVFSDATSGTAWQMTASGVPLVTGGSNQFGNDALYDYSTADMCPICGGTSSISSASGVWAVSWLNSRTSSSVNVGFRSALYI